MAEIAETDPADFEFAIDGTRTSAELTTPLGTGAEFRSSFRFLDFRFAGHGRVSNRMVFGFRELQPG